MNRIENKLHLKENLDRELTFLKMTTLTSNPNNIKESEEGGEGEGEDRILIKNLYESCYAGYKNYRIKDEITKEMAATCSKYLFFRKTKS